MIALPFLLLALIAGVELLLGLLLLPLAVLARVLFAHEAADALRKGLPLPEVGRVGED